jgi:hypothetical protein
MKNLYAKFPLIICNMEEITFNTIYMIYMIYFISMQDDILEVKRDLIQFFYPLIVFDVFVMLEQVYNVLIGNGA